MHELDRARRGPEALDGGRAVSADPWMLFSAWLDELPLPPGIATPKVRRLEFLAHCKRRLPLWLGVRGADEKVVWNAFAEAGFKPWIHRHVPTAAKLPPETDLSRLDDFARAGWSPTTSPRRRWPWPATLTPASWWVSGGEGVSPHSTWPRSCGEKGLVVCTFEHPGRRKEAALRLRGGPLHNISTRLWDGRHSPARRPVTTASCSTRLLGRGHCARIPTRDGRSPPRRYPRSPRSNCETSPWPHGRSRRAEPWFTPWQPSRAAKPQASFKPFSRLIPNSSATRSRSAGRGHHERHVRDLAAGP